jgi:Trypsin-like peptidase domain
LGNERTVATSDKGCGLRQANRLISLLVALTVLLVVAGRPALTVQSNPILEQPELAVVQIAQWATIRKDGVASDRKQPIGSGSIVSPGGLILTNHHVIDTTAFSRNLEAEGNDQERQGHEFTFDLVENRFVILTAGPSGTPVATYTATAVVEDPILDLAVLKIDGGPQGEPIALPPLPYLELGDSDLLQRGDRLELLGFPGDVSALFSSSAEVGSLLTEEGVVGRAWIVVGGATVSGGSSGGPALDDSGRLVAVTTSVPLPECRPAGDTNGDGIVDQADTCVPVGGTFAHLRPVNLARPLLRQADPTFFSSTPVALTPTATATSEPTRTPVPTPTSTPLPTPTPTPMPSPTAMPTPSPSPPSTPTPTAAPEPAIREPTVIPLASLLPDPLVLPQGQPFRVESEGASSFEDMVAGLPEPQLTRELLAAWGWEENVYRIYASDDPPPDAVSWLALGVHRFASADGAAEALPYFAAARRDATGFQPVDIALFADQTEAMTGQAVNGEELIIYARRGNLVFRVDGVAPNGDPTGDVFEALLVPLRQLADEPSVASPELFDFLPDVSFKLPGLSLAEEHARSAATIAESFPDVAEAEQFFQAWGWRESAARVFTGNSANGTHRVETVIFRLADTQAAAEALPYFLEGRAEALDLIGTDPPPVRSDEARAIRGLVADGNEVTVYVRRGRDLFRISAFGGDNPMADIASLLASW